ncbi:MAG: TonB-dependent receptor [Limisphaerales bacterium]
MKHAVSSPQSAVSHGRTSRALCHSLLSVLAATAAAQESRTNAPAILPTMVVTATRTEEAVDKTAASITVLTREDFEASRLTTLADALDQVAGLAVVRNGTQGQPTSVFARGTKSNHILLTVDGRRVPAMLAGGYDWSNLNLDGIERIEVLRSASSALYGGDAIGGVVNVRTLSGRGLAAPVSEASFEGGSFQTYRESLTSRGAFGKFDYSASASRLDAAFPRNNNDQRLTAFRSGFGYELTPELYADLKGSYYQADGGTPGATSFPTGADHLKREATQFSPGLTWTPTEAVETKLLYTFENQFQPSLTFGDTERLNVLSHLLDWQTTAKITDAWKVTGGMLWQEQAVQRTSTGFGTVGINAHATTLGGFGQSQWEPLPDVTLINAVRFDAYSDFASALTWRQGLAWTVPGPRTVLFGNVSHSVAVPTAQDLYYTYDDGGFFKSAGNPNLRPERALSFEVGLRQPLAQDKLELGAAFFRTQLKDAIDFVTRAYADPLPSRAENLSHALMEGAETSLLWKPVETFQINAAYTYLTAHNSDTGARLLRRPRHSGNLNFSYRPLAALTLHGGAQFVASRVDAFGFAGTRAHGQDYCVLRAGVSYAVTKSLTVWVRGENLTDVAYESVAEYPALRLGCYGGVKVTF